MHSHWFFRVFICFSVVFVAACSSSPDQPLKVQQFHLRDTEPADRDAQMVRGEQNYRLRGAVTLEQRQKRLGQYYTVSWNASAGQPTRVVMEYQQAGTGSLVKKLAHDLPQQQSAGKVEFQVVGDDYNKGGRVLAWRVRLLAGDRVLAEKRSYLWR